MPPIKQKPKFKIGDRVRILPKNPLFDYHNVGYTPQMETLAGNIWTILSCKPHDDKPIYVYKLKEDEDKWNWIEEMLELVPDYTPKFKVGDTVKIKERTHDPYDYPLCYADNMEERYAGKTAIIVQVDTDRYCASDFPEFSGLDECRYILNIDDGAFEWDCAMLELVSTPHIQYVIDKQDNFVYKPNFNLK